MAQRVAPTLRLAILVQAQRLPRVSAQFALLPAVCEEIELATILQGIAYLPDQFECPLAVVNDSDEPLAQLCKLLLVRELNAAQIAKLDELASAVQDGGLTSKIDRLVTASNNGYPLECQNTQNQLISDLLRPGQASFSRLHVFSTTSDWDELFLDQ